MASKNISTAAYALIAGVLTVTAVVLVRMGQVQTPDLVPLTRPRDAGEVYRQRIEATQKLLQEDRLDL